MVNLICTAINCVQLNLGIGQAYIRTPDSAIYQTDNTSILCIKQAANYNCRPTNNFYNPLNY
jgi:hypothetical protein